MFIEEETGEIFRYQVTADRTLVFELKPATLSDMQTLEKKIWQTIGELKLLGANDSQRHSSNAAQTSFTTQEGGIGGIQTARRLIWPSDGRRKRRRATNRIYYGD